MNIVHKVSGRYTLLSLEISHEVGRGRRSHKIHKSRDLAMILRNRFFFKIMNKQEYNELNLIISYVALLVSSGD